MRANYQGRSLYILGSNSKIQNGNQMRLKVIAWAKCAIEEKVRKEGCKFKEQFGCIGENHKCFQLEFEVVRKALEEYLPKEFEKLED